MYHTEMRGKTFLEWVKNKWVLALYAKSRIVMDNAQYHSMQDPDSKAPTSNSLKVDMVTWLRRMNMTFPSSARKPQLYEIINSNKSEPMYIVDNYIKAQGLGHPDLRHTPYYGYLNPE